MSRALLAALLICSTFTPRAHACDCGPTPSPQEAYDRASDVVIARVEDVDGPYHEFTDVGDGGRTFDPRYRVRVLARWKGRPVASSVIRSALDPKKCAYPLVVGETFLLYADQMGEGDTLIASACTRSERASLAGDEIRRLDRAHPRSGTIPRRLTAPDRCPVHQDIPLRTTETRLAGFLPATAESEYRRIRAARFPFAALQFKHPPAEWDWIGTFATDVPAITCALCRNDAMAWCRDHGADCERFPDYGMAAWHPQWIYEQLVERDRHPSGPSGFYYEDGNGLQFDSLTGNLTRHVEGYGDTTIHVNLGKEQDARLFEEIVESGFFRLGPALDDDFDSGPPGPCGQVVFCAASDSAQKCDWWYRSFNISSASRAKFNRLLEEIRILLETSPEYRALPPLPKGL